MSLDDNLSQEQDQSKRPAIGFISVFKRARSEDDRGFINSVLAFAAASSTATIGISAAIDGWKGAGIAVTTLLSAAVTGAVFSLLDRIGVVAPVEERLSSLVRAVEQQSNYLEDVTQEVLDYTKYSHARKRFGLSDVRGELITSNNGNVDISRGKDEFAIRQFEAAKPGTLIRYMNTYLEDEARYYDAIKDAIERGVHVRLLMINPNEKSAAFINRYNDCLRQIYEDQTMTEISDLIRSGLRKLERLKVLRERRVANGVPTGEYEIRFYDRSMNFPMMIITEQREFPIPVEAMLGSVPEVAYTGFYGRISSEAMPYIEWRGGQFRAIQRFAQMFDDKWTQYTKTSLDDIL